VLPQNSDWASAQKVILKVRKRVLTACLDVAIMSQLSERRVLSATNIISIFKKRYNIQLSAGTVYPVLYALEKDGNIRRLPNRRKKLYVLTSKGKETIKNFRENVGNLNTLINELIMNSDANSRAFINRNQAN
jgi:DNA-binding PadR family transcriptional regulator